MYTTTPKLISLKSIPIFSVLISWTVYTFVMSKLHGLSKNLLSMTDYEAMTLFIPKFQVYSKQYPKWFTKELRHQIKCLHTLRRNYKRSPSDHNATRLNQAENSFQINAGTAKSNYETNLINTLEVLPNLLPSLLLFILTMHQPVVTFPELIFSTSTSTQFSPNHFHSQTVSILTHCPVK